MDWIKKAGERRRAAQKNEEKQRDWTLHVASELREGRENNFHQLAEIIRSTAVKLGKELGTFITISDEGPDSLVIRKEDNPGARIELELESSGKVLIVRPFKTPNAFKSYPLSPFKIEISLDSSGNFILSESESGEKTHMDYICQRIFQPIYEAMGVSLKDD
jgi:hypothetical protein